MKKLIQFLMVVCMIIIFVDITTGHINANESINIEEYDLTNPEVKARLTQPKIVLLDYKTK